MALNAASVWAASYLCRRGASFAHALMRQLTLLFLPETSCERGNKYLDRSVLVPTVDKTHLAFLAAKSVPDESFVK